MLVVYKSWTGNWFRFTSCSVPQQEIRLLRASEPMDGRTGIDPL